MSGISPASSAALSGLNAACTRLNSSAKNIANINSDGYVPETTSLSDDGSGGVQVTVSDAAQNMTSAPSGTDYVQESLVQMTSAIAFQANLKTLQTSQSMDMTLMALGLPSSS